MKTKVKSFTIIILAVFVGIMFIIILQRQWKQQQTTSVNEEQIKKDKETEPLSIDDKLKALSRPSWFTEDQWKLNLKVIKEGVASNHSIDFFAKVVDQCGEPVKDAIVQMEVTRFNEGILQNLKARPDVTADYETRTDSKGNFRFSGSKGYSFEVVEVIKEGYTKITGGERYRYSNNWGKERFSFDPNKPEIIRVLNESKTEPLYKDGMKSYKVAIGETYFLDLKKRKFDSVESKNSVLAIEIKKGEKREHRKGCFDFDWGYVLRAVNDKSAIINANNQSFIAPDSGYKDKVLFPEEGHNKKDESMQYYFFRDKNKRYYSIKLDVRYWEGDNFLVEMEYLMNPTPGSRNLAYDSSKALRDYPGDKTSENK